MIIDIHSHLQMPALNKHLKTEQPDNIVYVANTLRVEQDEAGIDF